MVICGAAEPDCPRFIPLTDAVAIARRGLGRAAPPSTPGVTKRNTVERCFSKCRQFRAVAPRYDKREPIYQGTVDVASIRSRLRDPVR